MADSNLMQGGCWRARSGARRSPTASARSASAHANWSDWYAEYMVAEQAVKALPS